MGLLTRDRSGRLKTFIETVYKQEPEKLKRRLFDLAAAYYIGKEVSSAFELEKCLNILTDRIAELMSVEIVSIMLLHKEEKELGIEFAKGLDKQIITAAKIKLGEGVAGWIAKTGKPLLIKDLTKDPRFPRRPRREGRYYTNSLLSVPLKIQDKVIGVINVNNKVSRDIFGEDDLDILQTVADLVAVAIENVRLQERWRILVKQRSDFIANISHELRTPLVTIKEAVQLILDNTNGEINEGQRNIMMLAKRNIERLGRMIDDLLELVKLEVGKEKMKRQQFDIVEAVKNIVASLKPLASGKEVSLKDKLPDKEIKIWGDTDKICQVVSNLIDNAIKYNRPNGSVDINIEEVSKAVKIYICDTGIGIRDKDISKVFGRFRRAEGRDTDEIKGLGLGLSITREIVQKHGGEISLESQSGKGSKFIVTLPKGLRKEEREKIKK